MIFGAEIPVTDSLGLWVIQAVAGGILALVGLLARSAFGDMKAELKNVTTLVSAQNVESAVMRNDVNRLLASEKSHEDRISDLEKVRRDRESGVYRKPE